MSQILETALDRDLLERLERRESGLARWLRENAPHVTEAREYLYEGSEGRAYWHYGYLVAVRDVLALLKGDTSTPTH